MSQLNDLKRQVQENFIFLKKMNSDIIKDLGEYSKSKNLGNTVFTQGLTFDKCLDTLKSVRDMALTDENYQAMVESNSIENLTGVSENLDIQIRHHKEVKNIFEYFISTN